MPWGQAEQVEGLLRREAVHGERARLDVRDARRRRDHGTRLQDDLFAVRSVTALRDHHGHDGVPNFHPRSDPRAHFIDNPSRASVYPLFANGIPSTNMVEV